MGKLEKVLDMIKSGVSDEVEIARRLGITRNEVREIIGVLEGLGYVERVKFGSKACETCPLKKICRGSCIVPAEVKAFKFTHKAFSLEK